MDDSLALLTSALDARYRIEGELGAGGTATVYRARDLRHERDVAIKVLKPELSAWLGTDRFLAEIRTTANLRHPHILPLFDSGDAGGLLFYVMPLVEGASLRDRLQRDGSLALDEALRITDEVADALAYAHARDVVHRDIKPENILLEGGHALVVDFGIARVLRELGRPRLTQTGGAVGTPAYMSPEQAAGDPIVDGRSDLYSLASVLFEMVSGKPPFSGATAEALLVQRFTKPAPRLSDTRADVPFHVDAAIHRALARDPEDRHPTVTKFVESLRAGADVSIVADQKSIAVLPFVNMSTDPENEYFSDGISEDIINALSGLAGLRVAARTSSFSFKGKHDDLQRIGDRLNVNTVLEGSVRRAGTRLRISVQLVRIADGAQLWSERYDRDLTDVFAVQDEIANAIAERLRVTFARPQEDRSARATSAQVEAYELYLKARTLVAKRGRSVLEGRDLLERATQLDPGFAPAFALLADALRQQAFFGLGDHMDALPRAKAALARALQIEPEHGEALGTRAYIALLKDRDATSAFADWEHALAINPMLSVVRVFYAGYGLCVVRGDDERAVAEAERAAVDDPNSPVVASLRAVILAMTGHPALAIAEAERAVSVDPDAFLGRLCLAMTYQFCAQPVLALREAQTALLMSGRGPHVLAMMPALYASIGERSRSVQAHREILARSEIEFVEPTWLALSALGVGEVDEAMTFAFRAVEERSPNQVWLVRRPGTEALHAHPSYPELRRRMGL